MDRSKQRRMYWPARPQYEALTSFLKANIKPWLIAAVVMGMLIYLATIAPTIT